MNLERARPLAAFVLVTALCAGVIVEGLRLPSSGGTAAHAETTPSGQPAVPGTTFAPAAQHMTGSATDPVAPLGLTAGSPKAGTARAVSSGTSAHRPTRPEHVGTPTQGTTSDPGHSASAGAVSTGGELKPRGHGNPQAHGHALSAKRPGKQPVTKSRTPGVESVKLGAGRIFG